jgi:site-specific DNA-methyltransferase (adenine-specific)
LVGLVSDRRGDGTIIGLGHSGVLRNGGQTGAAKQWEGWGTALKPAWEPIVLARKPLIGTVAENVLEHGTGALNIDGCRVSGSPPHHNYGRRNGKGMFFAKGDQPHNTPDLGRWPAGLCHDGSPEVLAAFPDSDGQQGDVSYRRIWVMA